MYKRQVKNKINFKITNFYGSLPDYYEYLFKMGKTIYISNYYGSADGGWAADFIKLTDKFEVKKETEGCLGNCSIYRLTKLKKI